MKAIVLSVVSIALLSFISCQSSLDKDTTIEIPYTVSAFQDHMLNEINFARTNPAIYADIRLRTYMQDSIDNGSYLFMKSLTPLKALLLNNSLNITATNYALFLADNNLFGHDLNGTALKRAIAVGYNGDAIGENIAASSDDIFNPAVDSQIAAISFVRITIIDACVPNLGHRKMILNSFYTTIGIGYGNNPSSKFVNYNVQEYGSLN